MTSHIRVLIIGAGLILVGNAFALIGVAYNRSGGPNAIVELSERELTRPYNYMTSTDNSGLALHLNWRSAGDTRPSLPGDISQESRTLWLDKDKLAELGFDVGANPQDPVAMLRYNKMLPRKAYTVLEFNGLVYQAAVQQTQALLDESKAKLALDPNNKMLKTGVDFAQRQVDDERNKSSRLFAVDVGPDPETLRARYSDRTQYIILPSEVRLSVFNKILTGYITGLNVNTINVPLAYRTAITGEGGPRPANFIVRLAFGKRAEPWILDAQPVLPE